LLPPFLLKKVALRRAIGALPAMHTMKSPMPLTASTGGVTEITGLPGTTLRHLARTDPTFPRPWPINGRGDLRWAVHEVVAWLEAKAGRPLAA
jgi:predicted DNA-binding transcriptional regulator AlpA